MSDAGRQPLAPQVQHAYAYDGQSADERRGADTRGGMDRNGPAAAVRRHLGHRRVPEVAAWVPARYIANLKMIVQGQPSFWHGWFHLGINLQSAARTLFAILTRAVIAADD